MSIALVTSASARSASGTATTTPVDTTGASLIAILITCAITGTITVTDNKSNTITFINTVSSSTGRSALYYILNPTVGAGHTFTVAGPSFRTIAVMAFSGIDTTAPLDKSNQAFANSGTSGSAGSITPAANGELIVAGIGLGNSSAWSIDSGFTNVISTDFGSGAWFATQFAYFVQPTAAAINPTWSWTTSTYNEAVIGSFKASGPSGLSLVGRGRAGAFLRGGLAGALELRGRGSAQIKGKVGENFILPLIGRTFAGIAGKGAAALSLALKGRSSAQIKLRGEGVYNALVIHGKMLIGSSGKLYSQAILPTVQAFTAYFWRRRR